jgi:voltage-gated potassium channel
MRRPPNGPERAPVRHDNAAASRFRSKPRGLAGDLMTGKQHEELAPVVHRRAVAASLLRSVAAVVVLVAVYYWAPLDHPLGAGTWIGFALGLLVFGAVLTFQVRAILGSAVPKLRAIQAVAVGLPLLLLLFASTYFMIARDVPGSFTEEIGRTDALYFTVTVFATVGFGDITPRTDLARIVTMIQMITNLVAVGLVARVVFGAARVAVRRREGAEADMPVTASSASQASALPGGVHDGGGSAESGSR